MYDPYRSKPIRGRTNFTLCICATVFRIFIIAAIVVAYFFPFKPKSLKFTVEAVQLAIFSVTNDTVNFTFFPYVSVTNPNWDEFTHYDNSLQLNYSGEMMGLVFILAGKIDSGSPQHMSANFNVQSYPLQAKLKSDVSVEVIPIAAAANGGYGGVGVGPTMEVETRIIQVSSDKDANAALKKEKNEKYGKVNTDRKH
ncbi:hypothetical protein RND71_035394 [Anisodus tanguticus]|uniref:Late embryogenesis abundant protein LEA-2 subgroup domain-containing protein n=1 Tax=Anisodus tanguticus TaxID=243964 RepID=A0AAE1UUF4_9SOLA|nr:hypothetical protein RND71_035394 [Anisodus tanguticus]